jgi:hypothetical protein
MAVKGNIFSIYLFYKTYCSLTSLLSVCKWLLHLLCIAYVGVVAMAVNKSIVRSVIKKIVCSDRIIILTLKAELVSILIAQVYAPASDYEVTEWKNFMT